MLKMLLIDLKIAIDNSKKNVLIKQVAFEC